MTSCTCGHSKEEHGGDPDYPGATDCVECECIAYEVAYESKGDNHPPPKAVPTERTKREDLPGHTLLSPTSQRRRIRPKPRT